MSNSFVRSNGRWRCGDYSIECVVDPGPLSAGLYRLYRGDTKISEHLSLYEAAKAGEALLVGTHPNPL